MRNQSQLSDFSSTGILTIKPQVYEFDGHLPEKSNINSINKSMTVRIGPLKEQIIWRPKIPSKKLFEEPKFLLSMERKKVRVINGIRESDFEIPFVQRNEFKSERIKIRRQNPSKFRKQMKEELHPEASYIHSNLNKGQKNKKIPLVNFNLQHLIKQRKTFKSQDGTRKKGNNDPYYSFISSERFESKTRQGDPDDLFSPINPKQSEVKTSKTTRIKMHSVK